MTDEQTIRAALPFDRYPALDRLVAERDALRARVDEAVADEPRDADLLAAALARAEAAEKEAEMYRREAAHARTLASGWAEANAERSRAEAAEKERDEANKIALDNGAQADAEEYRARKAEARCATLEAALREIAEQKWVARPDGPRPAWCSERSPFWNFLTPEEIARAALAAATPPAEEPWGSMDLLTGGTAPTAEWCPTCGTTPCPDCQPAEEEEA